MDNPATSHARPRIRKAASENLRRKAVTVADLHESDREKRDECQQIRDEPRPGEIEALQPPPTAADRTERRRTADGRFPRAVHVMLPVMDLGALSAAMPASCGKQAWRAAEELWR